MPVEVPAVAERGGLTCVIATGGNCQRRAPAAELTILISDIDGELASHLLDLRENLVLRVPFRNVGEEGDRARTRVREVWVT